MLFVASTPVYFRGSVAFSEEPEAPPLKAQREALRDPKKLGVTGAPCVVRVVLSSCMPLALQTRVALCSGKLAWNGQGASPFQAALPE